MCLIQWVNNQHDNYFEILLNLLRKQLQCSSHDILTLLASAAITRTRAGFAPKTEIGDIPRSQLIKPTSRNYKLIGSLITKILYIRIGLLLFRFSS